MPATDTMCAVANKDLKQSSYHLRIPVIWKVGCFVPAGKERQYDAQLAAADWRARVIKLADTYDYFKDATSSKDSAEKSLDMTKPTEKLLRGITLIENDIAERPSLHVAIEQAKSLLA